MIRFTVNAITYSLVLTGTVYDVTSVSAHLTICSVMETSLKRSAQLQYNYNTTAIQEIFLVPGTAVVLHLCRPLYLC